VVRPEGAGAQDKAPIQRAGGAYLVPFSRAPALQPGYARAWRESRLCRTGASQLTESIQPNTRALIGTASMMSSTGHAEVQEIGADLVHRSGRKRVH
jgi:hypothetical protein